MRHNELLIKIITGGPVDSIMAHTVMADTKLGSDATLQNEMWEALMLLITICLIF